MTKFDYCSDLHLDIYYKKSDDEIYKIIDTMMLKEERAENLIICGDISTASSDDARFYTVLNRWCKEHYNNIFVVLGNHDHYNGELYRSADNVQRLMPNCIVLDIRICPFYELSEDVVVVGSTMWTNIKDPFESITIMHSLNDYRAIRVEEKPLVCEDVTTEYERTMGVFDALVKRYPNHKMVFCTHHVPIPKCGKTFRMEGFNAEIDGAYYVDNSNFILDNPNIVAWVCGHIHETVDKEIGNCKVLANCRGYSWTPEAMNFVLREFEI